MRVRSAANAASARSGRATRCQRRCQRFQRAQRPRTPLSAALPALPARSAAAHPAVSGAASAASSLRGPISGPISGPLSGPLSAPLSGPLSGRSPRAVSAVSAPSALPTWPAADMSRRDTLGWAPCRTTSACHVFIPRHAPPWPARDTLPHRGAPQRAQRAVRTAIRTCQKAVLPPVFSFVLASGLAELW